MIKESELIKIGFITKTHGTNGDLYFQCQTDAMVEDEVEFIVFSVDGLFVPFYINYVRFFSQTNGIVQLDGIENETDAKTYVGNEIFLHQRYKDLISNDIFAENQLIGYNILDSKGDKIGEILDVNDENENILLIVKTEANECYIPLTDDFIISQNNELKTITMQLPDGLLNLDN